MRIDQLTFTRFLAAVSIVVFHYGGKSFVFNNDLVSFIFSNADVCVSYFFILSGFVMMIAYGNKSVIIEKEYYRNRFARIYPVYFLAILLTLFLQLRTNNLDLEGFFLNIFMMQAWIPGKLLSFNPPGWSLSVELIFYLIFPFVFNKGFKKIDFKLIAAYVIIFWFISQIFIEMFFLFYSEIEFTTIGGNPLMHLNEFLIGNLAGFLYVKKLQDKRRDFDFLILLLVALILFTLKTPLNLNYNNGLLAILFIPLILLLSLNNGFISKLFQKKAFVFLGEISYGIYILQFPIYSIFSAYSVYKYLHIDDPTIVFFIRLVILFAVSSLSYIYIEKPIQNKIKSSNKLAII